MTTEPLALHGGPKAFTLAPAGSLHGVLEIGDAEVDAVSKVLRRGTMFRFLNPPDVSESARLEARFRERLGVPHALAVGGGGTAALVCALVGLGISSGDEVLVPGYTYIATASACLLVGALPIVCEVDESLTLDARDIEAKLTPHTRAIIAVHMRGAIANMDAILAAARKHNLTVIEDCAQANGGVYRGRSVGAWGDAGAFSMQHYKVITAGEGGMVTTSDPRVYRRAAMRHDSAVQFWERAGAEGSEWESFAGENNRMDELRAALALAQLDRMDDILARCRGVKRALVAGTSHLAGIRQQTFHDASGDLGITFAFFLHDAATARAFSEALTAEGLANQTIYNKQIPDRHIYARWDYIMRKQTHDATGWPWTAARRPIAYSPDMLPQTLDVLGRCVAIGLNQRWTDAHVAQACNAIAKVHAHVCA